MCAYLEHRIEKGYYNNSCCRPCNISICCSKENNGNKKPKTEFDLNVTFMRSMK